MKHAIRPLFLVALLIPIMSGCSRKGDLATVADQSEIGAYVTSNPDSDAGTEPEGADP